MKFKTIKQLDKKLTELTSHLPKPVTTRLINKRIAEDRGTLGNVTGGPITDKNVVECHNLDDVVNRFDWENSVEGHQFWYDIAIGLKPKYPEQLVAKVGEVVSYKITKEGSHWKVGCQRIDKRQRRRLFKLLAKDLGYELC